MSTASALGSEPSPQPHASLLRVPAPEGVAQPMVDYLPECHVPSLGLILCAVPELCEEEVLVLAFSLPQLLHFTKIVLQKEIQKRCLVCED